MELHHYIKRQNNGNNGQPNMPSLWIFLLIVLGVLLTLVMGTSFVMHMIQRRQRTVLARRIANGEVDLEVLGLKRLNVPQEQIDKMEQYVWTADASEELKRPDPVAGSDQRHSTMFGQSTCPICLDDFVDRETMVRELPCNHIFHPECIDPFLLNNSSLCPVCKKSALPAGFCPVEVTNVMVRRERLGRAMRRNQTRTTVDRGQVRQFEMRRIGGPNHATSTPAVSQTESSTQDAELGRIRSNPPDGAQPPPEVNNQGEAARRAWRRERVASQHIREFEQHGEASRMAEERRPWWRRWIGLN